jgi:hypothetical protein
MSSFVKGGEFEVVALRAHDTRPAVINPVV